MSLKLSTSGMRPWRLGFSIPGRTPKMHLMAPVMVVRTWVLALETTTMASASAAGAMTWNLLTTFPWGEGTSIYLASVPRVAPALSAALAIPVTSYSF